MRAAMREWTSRLGGVFGRSRSDQDLEQELRLHLELVEQDLLRQGLSPEAAAREARVRIGRPAQAMELLRDRRGVPSLSAFWLDAKLGLRMLRKHWGLTLIGGLTLVVSMTIGASVFNLVHALRGTALPIEDGDRVVVIQPFDPETRQIRDSSREDFARWRAGMRTVENVSAFRAVQRNLIAAGAPPAPVTVAEMSASGFPLFRTTPHLGRFLLPEDELGGAPPVLVIGYNVWRPQFSADPGVLGRQVRLDGVPHTIVGVMPRRFAFPVNHRYWTSLRPDGVDRVVVFARLAAGASVEAANAEVQPLGFQPPLQSRVVPYVSGLGLAGGPGDPIFAFLPFALPLLLVPPCANIAILIYARTVARQGEFAARSALGASRGRIVSQILIEVLLLAAGAAAVAVLLASQTSVLLQNVLAFGDRPFWLNFELSYQTILYAAGLAAIAAMIAGGIPAMRATGSWTHSGMHALKGGSNPRLGKVWTAVVVAQVALSVAVVPVVTELAWNTMKPAILGPGFDARPFLTARLAMDNTDGRFAALREAVVRQLKAEPGVTAVTLSETVPFEERDVLIELEGAAEKKSVSLNHVDEAFFQTFAVPLLAGRSLSASDANPAQGAVLVNRAFAQRILGGGNPMGRRVRPVNAPAYEIVGVVGDLHPESQPVMYRPLDAPRHEVRITLRAGRTAAPHLGRRLQDIVAALDPSVRVDDLQTLDEIHWRLSIAGLAGGGVIASLTLAAVLFSVAGIYTSMAFALVERRREIGIRAALGAPPARLIAGAFRRVLLPVGVGMVLGSVAAGMLESYLSPLLFDQSGARPLPWILPAAEAFVLLTALIALWGPVRRALRVDPFATLRES